MTPLLINTRPNARYELDGVAVAELPLLSLMPKALDGADKMVLQDFLDGQFDLVVAVSQMAVRCFFDGLDGIGISELPNLPIFVAVGKATQATLKDYGVQAITPMHTSNEGMLAMREIGRLTKNDKVLIIKGTDGRTLLKDTLSERGVGVVAVDFYDRVVNERAGADFDRLIGTIHEHSPVFILITSQMSLMAWADLVGRHPSLASHFIYLALGERLTRLTLRHYPNGKVICLDNLSDAHVSQTIKSVLQYSD